MVLIQAEVVDATHIELSKPIAGPAGRKVLVSVAEPADRDAEYEAWLALSGDGLRSAYGDSEPDYMSSMVRELNPEYTA